MNEEFTKRDQVRRVILVACQMLEHTRRTPPRFGRGHEFLNDDCYMLLDDAARFYCAALSESRGEAPASRWSDVLPKLLFEHPDRCDEILAMVESNDYQDPGDVHATVA